jgi:hypothetical protein
MAHLLVIESWVGASSLLPPRAIIELGHRFTFVARILAHHLAKPAAPGVHPLPRADLIVRCETNDLSPRSSTSWTGCGQLWRSTGS